MSSTYRPVLTRGGAWVPWDLVVVTPCDLRGCVCHQKRPGFYPVLSGNLLLAMGAIQPRRGDGPWGGRCGGSIQGCVCVCVDP